MTGKEASLHVLDTNILIKAVVWWSTLIYFLEVHFEFLEFDFQQKDK